MARRVKDRNAPCNEAVGGERIGPWPNGPHRRDAAPLQRRRPRLAPLPRRPLGPLPHADRAARRAGGGRRGGAARREIMTQGAVPLILAAQNADGHFGRPGRFYNDKYTGTVWQLIVLAELGADPGGRPRPRRLRGHPPRLAGARLGRLLRRVQQEGRRRTRQRRHPLPHRQPRLQPRPPRLSRRPPPAARRRLDRHLAALRRRRGRGAHRRAPTTATRCAGEGTPATWARPRRSRGSPRSRPSAAPPPSSAPSPTARSTSSGTTSTSAATTWRATPSPAGSRFGFPLMYQTDVLEILGILAKLGDAAEAASARAERRPVGPAAARSSTRAPGGPRPRRAPSRTPTGPLEAREHA